MAGRCANSATGQAKGAGSSSGCPRYPPPLPVRARSWRKPPNYHDLFIAYSWWTTTLIAVESTAVVLRLRGHEVATAYDGPSALDAVGTFNPEIVLLDIGLPGMSGYDVARHLRARPEHKSLVLIAVTGYGQPRDRQQTEEAGFDGHLVKPVDQQTLAELLDIVRHS